MKKNVMIIGAGGVAHVAAHKCAQNNDVLGDICIASRTLSKCEDIIASIKRKNSLKDGSGKLIARQLDAHDVAATVSLIRETNTQIVINLGTAFLNMHILDACVETGVAYMDTAIHEDPEKVCEDPPWYANYEWKRKDECRDNKITAVLGAGFDPGVVNAYAALGVKKYFDKIDTIDIIDVNAGSHGKYFATNFDPEINFREFIKVLTWIDKEWKEYPTHTVKRICDLPVVGPQPIYLNGHDEIHSLSKNIDANSIRFWMGFGDHYINVFTVLRTLGLLSHLPVKLDDGHEVAPLKVIKAVFPDPKTLAPGYSGNTCIGDYITGTKNGKRKEMLIYQVSDHKKCYEEIESQAISYTAGVPPVAAAMLIAKGKWDCEKMVNVEELDPEPFIALLDNMGLPTVVKEIAPGSKGSFDGSVSDIITEMAAASATVTVSAANPMIALEPAPVKRIGGSSVKRSSTIKSDFKKTTRKTTKKKSVKKKSVKKVVKKKVAGKKKPVKNINKKKPAHKKKTVKKATKKKSVRKK